MKLIVSLSVVQILISLILLKKFPKSDCKPALISAIGMSVLVLSTYLSPGKYSTFAIVNYIRNSDNILAGRKIFLVVSFALILSFGIMKRRHQIARELGRDEVLLTIKKKNGVIIQFVSTSILIYEIYSKTPQALYDRQEYLPIIWRNGFLGNLISYVGYLSVVALSILLFQSEEFLIRFVSLLLLVSWFTMLFSSGSRSAILVPVSISLFLRQKHKPVVGITIMRLMLILTAIHFYSVILRLRDISVYGLKNSIKYIYEFTNISVLSTNSVLENLNSSVGIAGATKNSGRFTLSDFFTSINPLPGDFTNWSIKSQDLRISNYIPFSAYGEISSLGLTFTFFFFVIFSCLVLHQYRRLFQITQNSLLVPYLHISLFFGTLFLMLQYNLRSSMRIVYLLFGIYFLVKFINLKIMVGNRR